MKKCAALKKGKKGEKFMRYTILIAEDDPDIIDMLELYMNHEFQIVRAADGEEALKKLGEEKVDLALVDVMMPKMDGYEFIKRVRREYNLPVIILSAKCEATDKVMGLNIGADAYLTKPFNPFEVIAYIKALLRRFYELGADQEPVKMSKLLTAGELTLDPDNFVLKKRGQNVLLTASEFKILSKLMHTPGRVYTKAQLYECINGDYIESDDSVVMVHISNIRSKIEDDPSNPSYIKTIRGLGYKFEKKDI